MWRITFPFSFYVPKQFTFQIVSYLSFGYLNKGIHGDDDDLLKRKNAFGSNTYPRKKGRSFLNFLWDACRDTTLIILIVAAAASLGLGIKSEYSNQMKRKMTVVYVEWKRQQCMLNESVN
ncbi:hypothetical protein CsSME_00051556 [Camellia sinensis var. sinensis]